MEVYLDPESIQIGSGYYPLPMGNIYFVDDVGAFPDYDYLDFVSIVLVWWTNELMSFAWGAKTVKLRFVDEHYYIHLIPDFFPKYIEKRVSVDTFASFICWAYHYGCL